VKTSEEFYHAGRQVGWAIYLDGQLHYWNEQILDHGWPVASKKFEGGHWRLAFNCGEAGLLVTLDPASPYVGGRTLKWLKVKQPRYREGERGWALSGSARRS
jgi:hypothetical protein